MTNLTNQKTILLVEDDEPIIRAIQQRFEEENFNLIISRDGIEGLDTANQTHPDLILLDIIMPKMDGITMLKKIRKSEWGQKTPVIILTNLSNPVQEDEAAKLGVRDYLVKTDWRLEDVVKKIESVLKI